MSEIELIDHAKRLDEVYRLWLTGTRNPTTIAKQTGIKRAEVIQYIEESKQIARNDEEVKERAKEALHEYDASLNLVIERSWETVEQADLNQDLKTKAGILKNIGDLERQRVETLQKAGLYDDATLGDELAEMEEKAEAIKELLKTVAQDYPATRDVIMRGLSKIFEKPVGIVVDSEVNPKP